MITERGRVSNEEATKWEKKNNKAGGGGKEAVTTGSWMGFNPQGEQIQRELSMRRMKD